MACVYDDDDDDRGFSGEIGKDTYIHYDRRRLFLLPISYSAVQQPVSSGSGKTLYF